MGCVLAVAAPAGLLGRTDPSIASVNGGKVAEIQTLNPAFAVDKVLAKPGRTANGLRFVRKMGARRSYEILSLD